MSKIKEKSNKLSETKENKKRQEKTMELKEEFNFVEVKKEAIDSRCFGCLEEGTNLVDDPELATIYRELVHDILTDGLSPIFCKNCSTILVQVQNFKTSCIASLNHLTQFSKIEENDENGVKNEAEVEIDFNSFIDEPVIELKEPKKLAAPKISTKKKHKKPQKSTSRKKVEFDEPQSCEICNKKFLDVNEFDRHQRIGHQSLFCDHCGYKTNSKFALKRHILTKHMAVKRCYACEKFFYDVEEYKTHLKMEAKVRVKQCHMCDVCGFEAGSKSALEIHRARKHSKETFACESCNQTFTSKYTFRHHQQRFHEELPLGCSYCEKRFIRKRSLKKHIDGVHLKIQVECDICNKVVALHSLASHRKQMHSV